MQELHTKLSSWQQESFIVYDSVDNSSPATKYYNYILILAWILQNNLKVSLPFNANLLVRRTVNAGIVPEANADLFQ